MIYIIYMNIQYIIMEMERKFSPYFCVFDKLAQTDAKRIIFNLMFAVKSTHQSHHTDGGLSCWADAGMICFLPTSVSQTVSCSSFFPSSKAQVWYVCMLKILWVSWVSEIYPSNLGVWCVSCALMQLHMHDKNLINSRAWRSLEEAKMEMCFTPGTELRLGLNILYLRSEVML